jgi:hypothetical protein
LQSVRLLASHHSGFPIQVIPSLPLSRTIRDLPRSHNHPFVFIPTLSRHASPLWEFPVYGAAITYGKSVPIETSNVPNVEEGRLLAYPTTGSLVLRAKDRLRLFRKLLKKVLSKKLRDPPREGHPATVGFCIIQAVGGCF